MKLIKLVDKMKKNLHSWTSITNPDTEIYGVQLAKRGSTFKDNFIYIIPYSMLPKKPNITNAHFLCLMDSFAEKEPSAIQNDQLKACDLICFNDEKDPQDFLELVATILMEDTIMVNNMYRLIQALHSNQGIQFLIDEAYEVLNNPIILVDASYKILAICQNIVFDRPDLEAQKILGYMEDRNIDAMKKAKLYEKARAKGYPYYNKDPNAKNGWITALVNIHGIESAQIGVTDSNHEFTENDFELVDLLCRLVSLELQKSDFYKTNNSLMHSFFLSELLDDHMRDITTIQHRIQNLNWNVTEYMYIMTIAEQKADFFDRKAQLISKQLHQLLPNSRWVIYEGRIVFLICLPTTSIEIFNEGGSFAEYLAINNLTAAISRCFHSFLDVRKFYEESLIAYKLGQRFTPNVHLYFYEDYICLHIGEIISKKYNLHDFYHPVILQIQAYDEKHKTTLLETLTQYLTYPDNPTLVAEHLSIHKNTLFYRMGKLKEFFSIDLSNGEERLKIHMTLKFMELE